MNFPTEFKPHINVESAIKVRVKHEPGKPYRIYSEGMGSLNYPELFLEVQQGMFVATACHIVNDVASHLANTGRFVKDGMCIKLNDSTTVQLRKTAEGLRIDDGTFAEPRMI